MGFRWQRFVVVMALAGLMFPLVLFLRPAATHDPADPSKPRLVVMVVFDQLRGDYPAKWKQLYGAGGFRRLEEEAAWFTNCHYPYAHTLTAAGHTSLMTGTSPYKHGIIANEWYDRQSRKLVTAVESEKHRPVPMPPPSKDGKPVLGAAPYRRRAQTVGDVLLATSNGKSRVVSLSIKDRSSILLAALRALCIWFSTNAGQFVSSTYYMDELPRWASDFNRGKMADRWFHEQWDRLLPDLDYVKYSGVDDHPFEGIGYKQGRTFPHPLTGGKNNITREYYQAMTTSPYGNELLLAFAKRAIDEMQLGRGTHPDLLCLSFSSNDLIGHCWGPDSQEVLDITLRTDRTIKELLDYLDEKVGRGQYVFALTADHGVCPIPEVSLTQGKDAGRVPEELFTTRAEGFLNETFADKGKKLPWIEKPTPTGVYLNQALLKELKLPSERVERALADWLVKQPGVRSAYTRTQLAAGKIADDPFGDSELKSFQPDRSGDVTVLLKPYWQISKPITSDKMVAYRTTHGSPYEYDTHVPLYVMGSGIRPGLRNERVPPQVAAAILAQALGIPPPNHADYGVPRGLFEK